MKGGVIVGKEKKVRMCLSLDERVCGVVERLAAEECRSKSAWVNAALLRVFALEVKGDHSLVVADKWACKIPEFAG